MFKANVQEQALENTNFRKVIYTSQHSQLVLMSIPAGGDIGMEVHNTVDQFLFFVSGTGEAILNGESQPISAGEVVVVPAGTEHNFINTGADDLKLFTTYSPPNHPDGTIHATKAEADAAEHHE